MDTQTVLSEPLYQALVEDTVAGQLPPPRMARSAEEAVVGTSVIVAAQALLLPAPLRSSLLLYLCPYMVEVVVVVAVAVGAGFIEVEAEAVAFVMALPM